MFNERAAEIIREINASGEMNSHQRSKLANWATPVVERIVRNYSPERADKYLGYLEEMTQEIDAFVATQEDLGDADKAEQLVQIFISGAKIPVFETEIPHHRLKGMLTVGRTKMLEKLLDYWSLEDE